jgi:hypothetical protein
MLLSLRVLLSLALVAWHYKSLIVTELRGEPVHIALFGLLVFAPLQPFEFPCPRPP